MTEFAATYDELIANAWIRRYVVPPSGDTGNLWFNLGEGSSDTDEVAELDRVAIALNEVQEVAISGSPTGGDITLTFGGDTTDPIAYDASADDVRDALMALDSIRNPEGGWSDVGRVYVTGGPGPDTAWEVEFAWALGHTDQSLMTADDSGLTGGTDPEVTVTEEVAGMSLLGSYTDDATSGGRLKDNDAVIEMGEASGDNTATHGQYWTAETGGDMIQSHELESNVAYTTNQPVEVPAGNLDLLGAGYPD
ncbi:MAG: hypothetical protein ACOC9Y_05450 [Chloroflexota bacterium]